MSDRQEGLPTSSLILLAVALLLFGFGGGLVGYMVGERHGEQRAAAIASTLGKAWDAHRGDAASTLDGAIATAAAQLEKAAADLKAEVSMFHGCGNICGAIAHQFSEELLRARDGIKQVELASLAGWEGVLRESGIPVDLESEASAGRVAPAGMFSRSTVIGAITVLCATVAVCFWLACFTVLKLRIGVGGAA
jgi:hypothetical protein